MEYHELELSTKYLSGAGRQLNVHEQTGLSAGLTQLKQDESFLEIYFWGKLLGTEYDYYVAYGLRNSDGEFAAPQKKFYYASSKPGMDFIFSELPSATAAETEELQGICGRLSGNPANIINGAGGGEEAGEGEEGGPEKVAPIEENRRVAFMVFQIDQDSAVVPAGAYVLNADSQVEAGPGFRGLSWDEAKDMSNYAHFRPAMDLAALRVAARDDVEFHNNFLDSLAIDVPSGCWVTRVDAAQSFIQIRSLLWPGYVAYHAPGTRFFGGTYVGTGEKCLDLPFMLP